MIILLSNWKKTSLGKVYNNKTLQYKEWIQPQKMVVVRMNTGIFKLWLPSRLLLEHQQFRYLDNRHWLLSSVLLNPSALLVSHYHQFAKSNAGHAAQFAPTECAVHIQLIYLYQVDCFLWLGKYFPSVLEIQSVLRLKWDS